MARHRPSRPDPSRRYHDRVASRYDAIYDDPYWAFHDELTWRTIKPHLPRDLSMPCLDLGCGTGKWGLRLLKTGLHTTFVDHSPNMIQQTRAKIEELGPKSKHAQTLVADIIDLSPLPSERFALTLAMGDPISICTDPPQAVREMFRLCRSGGVVIATADSKLAALDHFMERSDIDALDAFIRTGRTRWLTAEAHEQFELTCFTPITLRKLFESAGFEILELIGKTILPVRQYKEILNAPGAMDRLLDMERTLAKDPSSAGKASHLQITARRPNG